MTAPQGSLAAIIVSLTSLNSFAGSVNLNYSLSPGITNVTIALNPGSVSLLTGSGTSTLTVSVPASAPLSTYTIIIDGASRRLCRTSQPDHIHLAEQRFQPYSCP